MRCERCGGAGNHMGVGLASDYVCPDCNGTGEKPESLEKPLQNVKNDYDERIREAFQKWQLTDNQHGLYMSSYGLFKSVYLSRDEEVELQENRNKQLLHTKDMIITALRAQIEEMKCCGSCEKYINNYLDWCKERYTKPRENKCDNWKRRSK